MEVQVLSSAPCYNSNSVIIKPIKTERVEPETTSLFELLDKYLENFSEGSVIAVTSKIISLCEGRVVATDKTTKDELAKKEASYYLSRKNSKYGHLFTITNNTLISSSGIDSSNGNGYYVLWPKNPQQTANKIRKYLLERFGVKKAGVVITDSTCRPMRLGTTGISLAHSGFEALNDYTDKKDLFGRPFALTRSNVAEGLASSAVLTMGEGTEQTPLAIISDVGFVEFQDRNPTKEEIEFLTVNKEDDLFAPFLDSVDWQKTDL